MKPNYNATSTSDIVLLAFLIMSLLAIACQFSAAALEGIEAEYNVKKKAPVAIDGYDPVGYFTDNHAVKGDKSITAEFRGITYRFASEEHQKLFTEKPEKYLPAYGGWCASAMAFGRKVEVNPESFIVEKGRLFLFYKTLFADAKKDWNENQPKWLTDADAAWAKITEEVAKPKE